MIMIMIIIPIYIIKVDYQIIKDIQMIEIFIIRMLDMIHDYVTIDAQIIVILIIVVRTKLNQSEEFK